MVQVFKQNESNILLRMPQCMIVMGTRCWGGVLPLLAGGTGTARMRWRRKNQVAQQTFQIQVQIN